MTKNNAAAVTGTDLSEGMAGGKGCCPGAGKLPFSTIFHAL